MDLGGGRIERTNKMKTKTQVDKVELFRLKFAYHSEVLWNRNILINKKVSDKVYKVLKKKYGITGRTPEVVMGKIDKLLK